MTRKIAKIHPVNVGINDTNGDYWDGKTAFPKQKLHHAFPDSGYWSR
jgi:hypothetical protein